MLLMYTTLWPWYCRSIQEYRNPGQFLVNVFSARVGSNSSKQLMCNFPPVTKDIWSEKEDMLHPSPSVRRRSLWSGRSPSSTELFHSISSFGCRTRAVLPWPPWKASPPLRTLWHSRSALLRETSVGICRIEERVVLPGMSHSSCPTIEQASVLIL